jgi:hypothetical protein
MRSLNSIAMRVALLIVVIFGNWGPRLLAQSSNYSETGGYQLHIRNRQVVLFPFDNYAIPFRSGLELTLRAGARNKTTVLPRGEQGQPDSAAAAFYGTVIPIDNKLHMWYDCAGDREKGNGHSWLPGVRWRVCYATSTDGVTWEKPSLGLVEYGGSTKNNLVALEPYNHDVIGCVVVYDPEDPDPAKRYKMAYETHSIGGVGGRVSAAYSRDGLTWTNSPRNPVVSALPLEPTGLIKRNGLYYLVGHGGNFTTRALVVHASPDFERWTEAVSLGFRRDDVGPLHPSVWSGASNQTGGRKRPTGEQVHLGAGLWDRGNVILGLYGQWHGPTAESADRRDLRMDIGFVVSQDALHYTEPIPDFKMIAGNDEKFALPEFRARLVQGQGFLNLGDQTLAWYSLWGPGGGEGVRLATWPRDRLGFYSVPAVVVEGQEPPKGIAPHFISCPIMFSKPETKIYLNAELAEHTQVTVEVLDDKFRPLPGFSGADSIPLAHAGLHEQVKWRTKQALGKLDGPVRIRVNFGGLQVERARVYAIYLE